MSLRALIWDVDGTVAETEHEGHRVAFNRAFEECGLAWHWDEASYRERLHIAGGVERLVADMAGRSDAPQTTSGREALARDLHRRKTRHYAELLDAGGIQARPGVLDLMREAADAGLPQAIATTTARPNVDRLFERLLGSGWRAAFPVVLAGEDVQAKKPHPEVYLKALSTLGLQADEALAFEDSTPGLAAATGAGLRTVLTPSHYFQDVARESAWMCCPDLAQGPEGPVRLDQLVRRLQA